MRDLRIAGGVFRPAPPMFAAIWMAPGCVFYAHRSMVREGVERVQAEVATGALVLPEGLSPAEMTLNRQAWQMAKTDVAGRA